MGNSVRKLHWSHISYLLLAYLLSGYLLLMMLSIKFCAAEERITIVLPEDLANKLSGSDLPRPHLRMTKTLFQDIDYDGEYFVPINQLKQTNIDVDDKRGEVQITLPATTFNATQIEGRKLIKFPPQLERGGFLNYDLFAQKDDTASQFDGRFELGVFNHYGVGISSMLASSYNG